MMIERKEGVVIALGKDDALILFDWLSRFNNGHCRFADDIERQSLCNLEAALEQVLVEPFQEHYSDIIAQTKSRIKAETQTEDSEVRLQLLQADEVIHQHPELGRAYVERSRIYARVGRSGEQIADLTSAIRLLASDPNEQNLLGEALYARGLAYQSVDEHARAIADFTSALSVNQDYSSVLQARAYSHIQLGQRTSASDDVDRAARLTPSDPHVSELRRQIQEGG